MSNQLPTIHQLRKSGYKVRINHLRYVSDYLISKREIDKYNDERQLNLSMKNADPKGGYTTIEITTPMGENFKSEAACSKKDSFNRRIALQICLGRLAKKHNFQIKE